VCQEEFERGMEGKREGEDYPGENSGFRLLEVGCGAGNTVFPLLSANNNPELFVYCCDFSKTAVDIVRNHEQFEKERCCPFVLDITDENPVVPFPDGSLDAVIMIFVISAISPNKFVNAARNIRRFLKPGGLVLLRDYGRFDLAQLRFRDGRCISENFYMRGDGTRVYFFTPEELEELFTTNGFSKVDISVDRRLQVNRSKQLKMYRIWILAKFSKCLDLDTT
jgi:SAM-dependent methyltransferase